MKKDTNELTTHIFQTIRNMKYFEQAINSLAQACVNLYREASTIALLEENHAHSYIQSTPNFLTYMAAMELHLHLLSDFYKCDYEKQKQEILSNLKIKYCIA